MSQDSHQIEVVDEPEASRYVARIDSEAAGFVEYELHGDRIVFTHTEIAPRFEGHGLGGRLASYALDDARARGLEVVARCPFIAGYIQRHPQYADLLASG